MLALELLVLLMVGAKLAPDSILGRWLIRAPAEVLGRMTLRGVLLAVLGFVFLLAFLAAGPEMIALFGLADLSLLADVAALVLLTGVSARFETARTLPMRAVRRAGVVLRRARRRRTRVMRPRPPARDDPASGPAWAFA